MKDLVRKRPLTRVIKILDTSVSWTCVLLICSNSIQQLNYYVSVRQQHSTRLVNFPEHLLPGPNEENPVINAIHKINEEIHVLDLKKMMDERKRMENEREEVRQSKRISRRQSEVIRPKMNAVASFIKSKRRPSEIKF